MKLFHFTCDHQMHGIKRDGLTLGSAILNIDPVRIANGYQWLTVNPDPNQQTWCAKKGDPSILKCDRTENRLTIAIPEDHFSDVLTLERLFIAEPMNINALEALKGVGRHEDWRVFKGRVPLSWISTWWHK